MLESSLLSGSFLIKFSPFFLRQRKTDSWIRQKTLRSPAGIRTGVFRTLVGRCGRQFFYLCRRKKEEKLTNLNAIV